LSWNCGAEGPTDVPRIKALRNRQLENYVTVQMLAAGTPMLLMGDEARRSRHGNNNAYRQDNEISWFDRSLLERHADISRFVEEFTAYRRRRDVVTENDRISLSALLRRGRIEWHGVTLNQPGWSGLPCVPAFTLRSLRERFLLHGIFTVQWESLTFELPPVGDQNRQAWRRCVDTVPASSDDIYPWHAASPMKQPTYRDQ
jgi:glycogen operon protein